jgi:hypothetical protein
LQVVDPAATVSLRAGNMHCTFGGIDTARGVTT